MSSQISKLLSGVWVYGIGFGLVFFPHFLLGGGNGQGIQIYLVTEDTMQNWVLLAFQSLSVQ